MKKSYKTAVAAICAVVMLLSLPGIAFADSSSWSYGPSAYDLDRIGADVKYPNYDWMYLDSYISATVSRNAAYCFKDPDTDIWRDGNYFTVYRGTNVTILAKSEGYACVILDGTNLAGWINEDYLTENYSYTVQTVPQYQHKGPYVPGNPQSSYGKALRKNLVEGVYYSDRDKASVVTETYYARHDAKGGHQPWYTASYYDDPNTGYRINFYFADGALFFADAYVVGKRSSVTFYFWGDQMLAVHDLRVKGSKLSFSGSADYNRIAREFGDLYAIAVG